MRAAIEHGRVRLGDHFSVSFQRTLRIPDDGRIYPLPPGLGALPVHRVEDYADRVPPAWRERAGDAFGLFIPMYQREALWLGFDGAAWKPHAVKVGIGKVNAISGGPWDEALHAEPQDYLVCPDQPWLDGINAGDGFIRQFVAMPLGAGYTVEAQLTGAEDVGGLQLLVYRPKPGRFADRPPPDRRPPGGRAMLGAPPVTAGMGLGAGGAIRQKVYPDRYGIDTWDPRDPGAIDVHIVNSDQYRELTGLEPPPTPISAATYTEHGLPWFDLYDEARGDVAPPDRLADVRTVGQLDAERGIGAEGPEASIDVPDSQVTRLGE